MKHNGNLRDRQRVLNVLTYAWRRLEEAIVSEALAAQAGLCNQFEHRSGKDGLASCISSDTRIV